VKNHLSKHREEPEHKNIFKKFASYVLSFIQMYCTNKSVMKENDGLPKNTNTELAVVTTTPNACGLNYMKKLLIPLYKKDATFLN
jgi:hypothetical protein